MLIIVKTHQENIVILNTYASKTNVPKFIKETQQLKSHIDLQIVILGDFNTSVLPIEKSSRQKLKRDMVELTDILHQTDITDIYRTFHTTLNKKLSSQLAKIGHKTGFYKYKNSKVKIYNLSDHCGLKLDTKVRKYTNSWKFNNSVLN